MKGERKTITTAVAETLTTVFCSKSSHTMTKSTRKTVIKAVVTTTSSSFATTTTTTVTPTEITRSNSNSNTKRIACKGSQLSSTCFIQTGNEPILFRD